MASTITVQNVLEVYRTWPVLTQVLGSSVAGYTSEPTLTFANSVVQEILAPGMNWQWNRVVASFVVNAMQQDYSTSITDFGWLESCLRTNQSAPEKNISFAEAVRQLWPTTVQGDPRQVSWVPNSQAVCGTWAATTTFVNPASGTALPKNSLLQIKDSNGNIQVVTTFGTTGGSQPTWATTPGQTTTDGSVVWTCINPNGITFRLSSLPQVSGTVWGIQPVYQKMPRQITALNQTWSGIPDELAYVYRQGFLAHALKAADDARYLREYETFQLMIQKALGSSDRERDQAGFYPSKSLMGGSGNVGHPFI